jgi:hypothetical protein
MLAEETSRSLPGWALHPATVVLFLFMLRAALKTPHASGRLLIAVVWLRYVMQAYHEFTYVSVGGVSINALASLGVCAVGALVLWRRLPELGRFPVLILLVLTIAASGLLNKALVPTIETLLKWGFFAVVMLATMDCMRRDGDARIFRLLLWAFAPVIVYQVLSVGLDVGKATESDGSVSFIGGYNHEAAFSVVLITCLTVASLAPRLNPFVCLAVVGVCLVGVVLANYRTSLFAAVPIVFGFFVFGIARGLRPGRRIAVSIVGLLLMMGAAVSGSALMADRMSDVGVVAEEGGAIIKSPEQFTEAERKLLSGRIYLWNRYIEDYSAGDDRHLLLGYGADSWVERFGLYAHNTLVSYLFEFGIVGAGLIIAVWLGMIFRSVRAPDWTVRGQLLSAHIGFVLLNMATMPFWLIEGLIFYGLLCGYTVAVTSPAKGPLQAQEPHALHAMPIPVNEAAALARARRERRYAQAHSRTLETET